MTSYIEMSLEDIIQKKKRENSRNKSKMKKPLPPQKQAPVQKLKIIDARNKIISKKRTQITDAREKLAELAKQKDARLKLQQLRERRQAVPKLQEGQVFHRREPFLKTIPRKERVFVDPSRQVIRQPLSHNKVSTRRQINNTSNKIITDNRTVGSRSLISSAPLKPILRTVENDIEIIDEPMEDDHIFRKTSTSNRKASLQLKIIAHNHDLRNNRNSTIHRSAVLEKDQSPPRPPSILKKRPMAALRNEKKEEKTEKPVLEYRIIVSNLRNTVTGGDIEELFGDVGGMLESRLVRPGTAEVIYKSIEDAQRAVDLYHNRQLDGQPMNCLLVTPRSTPTNVRTSTKPALYSTNSNVEPDISTFHKVLFSNF
ncbi:unnamed protein product [Parnassius mnemosyne]|uniref:RRM domain-containing protein n=1 Tax=Parnassius mnemosyne TaxID=213953 RepID=A0AAV1KJ19_9NEOP